MCDSYGCCNVFFSVRQVQGQMEEVIFDYLHMAAFHGHPLGDTILGPEENIRAIDRVDLQRYILTHYSGHRMVWYMFQPKFSRSIGEKEV